jgi:hypothetical protein
MIPCSPNVHTEWERKDTHIAPVLPECALGATCVPFQGGTASKLGRTIYEAVLTWAKRTSPGNRLRSNRWVGG